MIRRTTWITLGVFGVVLLAAIVARQRLESAPTPTPPPSPEPLWEVDPSSIATVTIEDFQSGTVLQLERDEADLWQIQLPEVLPADAARVERAVSWLAAPTPRTEIVGEIDLTAFELDQPHYRVEIVLKSGEQHEFSVGRVSPTGDSRYVSTPGRAGAQIMSLVGLEEVLNLADDVLPTPTPEPSPTPSLEPTGTGSPTPGGGAQGTPEP